MNKRIVVLGVIVLLASAALWWYTTSQGEMYPHTIAAGESVTSWDFKGTYTGNSELEARAYAEIDRLKALFGDEAYTEYELYVSIANQYNMLGDGKRTYEYLRKALAVDAEKTGLAWHNLGVLFDRLGVYNTALAAFDSAVTAQPTLQYMNARLDFLRTRMPENTDAIRAAEDELKNFPGEIDFN